LATTSQKRDSRNTGNRRDDTSHRRESEPGRETDRDASERFRRLERITDVDHRERLLVGGQEWATAASQLLRQCAPSRGITGYLVKKYRCSAKAPASRTDKQRHQKQADSDQIASFPGHEGW